MPCKSNFISLENRTHIARNFNDEFGDSITSNMMFYKYENECQADVDYKFILGRFAEIKIYRKRKFIYDERGYRWTKSDMKTHGVFIDDTWYTLYDFIKKYDLLSIDI